MKPFTSFHLNNDDVKKFYKSKIIKFFDSSTYHEIIPDLGQQLFSWPSTGSVMAGVA